MMSIHLQSLGCGNQHFTKAINDGNKILMDIAHFQCQGM